MNHPLPLPLDVRLMQWTAQLLLWGCVLALLVAAGRWLARAPVFALTHVVVEGDLTHTSALALRAHVGPQLVGNFFTLDLNAARQAFEQLPWVRRAQVQRVFPGGLRVHLQEQQAAAYWGAMGSDTLLNRQGEIFEAETDDVEESQLPRLQGPAPRAAEMLQLLGQLQQVLAPLGSPIESLTLGEHGGWRATLVNGAVIELGSVDVPALLARAQRLADTLAQVAQQQGRRVDQLLAVDLRYASGYALRLPGVTALHGEAPSQPAATPPRRAPASPAGARAAQRG